MNKQYKIGRINNQSFISCLKKRQKNGKAGVVLIVLDAPIGLTLEETVRGLCDKVLHHIDRYAKFIRKLDR